MDKMISYTNKDRIEADKEVSNLYVEANLIPSETNITYLIAAADAPIIQNVTIQQVNSNNMIPSEQAISILQPNSSIALVGNNIGIITDNQATNSQPTDFSHLIESRTSSISANPTKVCFFTISFF